MAQTLKQQAVRGGAWSVTSSVYTIVLQIAATAVLARLLDPSDFGLMAMLLMVSRFASMFADAGLTNAIIWRQDSDHEQMSSLYWLNVLVGIGAYLLVVACRPLAVWIFKEPRLALFLPLAALELVLNAFAQPLRTFLRRDLRFRSIALIEIICGTLASGAAIVMALKGFGVWSLVARGLFWGVIHLVTLVIILPRHWMPRLRLRWADLKGVIRFGSFQVGARTVTFLYGYVDTLLIGRFLGATPLGYYSIAKNLVDMPLRYFNPSVNQVAFPIFSRVQNDDPALCRGYGQVIHVIASVAFAALAGLFVVAPTFVVAVYGPKYLPTVGLLQILCIVGVARALGNPIGSLLLSKGRADISLYWNILGALVSLGVLGMAARWGVTGIAVGRAVVAMIFFSLQFAVRWYVIRMRPGEYLKALRVPFLSALLMALLVDSVGRVTQAWPGTSVLLLQVGLGVAAYSSLSWTLDKEFILEVWRLFRSRGDGSARDAGSAE